MSSPSPAADSDALRAWRKRERAELIALRTSVAPAQRKAWDASITEVLTACFPCPEEAVVGFCWPYRAEFDARRVVRAWRAQGARPALPEVVASGAPLQFRSWDRGVRMRPGVYDIPVPVDTPIVLPDILLIPMNGYDRRGFRLGYGGGYFDRTLRACERRVIAIGIAYQALGVETIHPQPHDIPMDFVVTEQGASAAGGAELQPLDDGECAGRFSRLLLARRLPRAAFGSMLSSPVCYADQFPDYWG